jgi:hypothetical protein
LIATVGIKEITVIALFGSIVIDNAIAADLKDAIVTSVERGAVSIVTLLWRLHSTVSAIAVRVLVVSGLAIDIKMRAIARGRVTRPGEYIYSCEGMVRWNYISESVRCVFVYVNTISAERVGTIRAS